MNGFKWCINLYEIGTCTKSRRVKSPYIPGALHVYWLTPSLRAYYIFSGPSCGIILRCPDNQINASFIEILRIKWLDFLLRSSFFRTTSTVASSEAPGKNPQKSELIHWRQCLLSGGTEACFLGLRETPACIHTIPCLSQPRVACWHGYRQNS